MSNIRDVAGIAGVSVATVSRVINKSGPVSERSRINVLKAINDLDYRPNLLGRNLRRTETRLILVLLPTIANPFYARIVKGIEDVARENGYNILLCNSDDNKKQERMYLELLYNRLADGLIFMAPQMDKDELTAVGRGFPVIQCCEYREGARASRVSINNYLAAYAAVKHILDLGHKKIALITCRNDLVSTRQRELGYRKALGDAGIAYSKKLVKYGDYSFMSGYDAARQLLSERYGSTAVFAVSDIMAIGAFKAIKEAGLSIPGDISVIGFDDVSFASMCDPMLTTICQPRYELGSAAMKLLLKQIRNEINEPESIVLEHNLVVRESTAAPACL
jgi:LacI family transcriptional regulator, repressor for deo operon, udp, cdd, tsx, nupC, and nupG